MTFFFYDVETSGRDPRADRIMQFAGQRTDANFVPIGEPIDALIRLTPDVLPEPDAVLVNGITPQTTLASGISEAAFLRLFYKQAVKPNTIFLGYNSISFDDEFMRFLHYRNFYDAYEWQWKNGCSRWDLLDVVRMIRALEPEGINWPNDSSGAPRNRLGLLTSANNLDHFNAHSALGDVQATIALARLLYQKQPELFTHLLSVKSKEAVKKLTQTTQPFVYTAGSYSGQFEHTAVVTTIASYPDGSAVLVYDLRYDPEQFLSLSSQELVERWQWQKDPPLPQLPVVTLRFNRAPAVAPLTMLDSATQSRLKIDLPTIEKHLAVLRKSPSWSEKLLQALSINTASRSVQSSLLVDELDVDRQLYDGFIDSHDKHELATVRNSKPEVIEKLAAEFHDSRLKALLPLYKARNFPNDLTQPERQAWQNFCDRRLRSGNDSRSARYNRRLDELLLEIKSPAKTHLLKDLQQYGVSLGSSEQSGF